MERFRGAHLWGGQAENIRTVTCTLLPGDLFGLSRSSESPLGHSATKAFANTGDVLLSGGLKVLKSRRSGRKSHQMLVSDVVAMQLVVVTAVLCGCPAC